jgi:4-alpha-glucanotransferase
MTADAVLAELGALAGVFPEFHDLEGQLRSTSPDTTRALLCANGLPATTEAEALETLRELRARRDCALLGDDVIVTAREPAQLDLREAVEWSVTEEDSGNLLAEGRCIHGLSLPALPSGVHQLHLRDDKVRQSVNLISAPRRTPSVADLTGRERVWGIVAALYGLVSPRNHGLGDFRDLADLAESLGAKGAGFLGINPVHALGWADETTISPYSPTHRGYLNPAHIAIDQLAGTQHLTRKTPQSELIDYSAHRTWHRAALREAFAHFEAAASAADRRDFAQFISAGGTPLADFARFEVISLSHGSDWRDWPDGVADSGLTSADATFHLWLQWVADRQLGEAHARAQAGGMDLGLYLDLAVGARLGGAEGWTAQGSLAEGVSLGAPPDHLSPAGQDWQLSAYAPRKLKANGYAPLRNILAQSMRHCGVLRIDHALGLNRSYWIPEDGSPGGYIRQPFQSLMAIIAIEAERAGTVIVGEDLGLVPPGFREAMAAKGFYGYTVLQYEKDEQDRFCAPQDLRPQSLACFGTHDTPTLRGFWEGHDIDWWHELGWINENRQAHARNQRAFEKADLGAGMTSTGDTTRQVAHHVHGRLAQGPTALAAVQLDDVLEVREAQNLPGTIDAHPNWRRFYPVEVRAISGTEAFDETACLMAEAGRSSPRYELEKENR